MWRFSRVECTVACKRTFNTSKLTRRGFVACFFLQEFLFFDHHIAWYFVASCFFFRRSIVKRSFIAYRFCDAEVFFTLRFYCVVFLFFGGFVTWRLCHVEVLLCSSFVLWRICHMEVLSRGGFTV